MSDSPPSTPAFPVLPDRLDAAVRRGDARRRRSAIRAAVAANTTVVLVAFALLLGGSSPQGQAELEVVDRPSPTATTRPGPTLNPATGQQATGSSAAPHATSAPWHRSAAPRQVAATAGARTQAPAVPVPPPPISGEILYTSYTVDQEESRLRVVDVATGVDREVPAAPGNLEHADWSPDGGRIAAVRYDAEQANQRIVVLDADGGAEEVVFACPVPTGCDLLSVRWSPDGRSLAFVRGPGGTMGGVCESVCTLNVVDLRTRAVKEVASPTTVGSWSPDSRRLVYWNFNDFRVYTVDVATATSTETSVTGQFVDWTPEGTFIATRPIEGWSSVVDQDARGRVRHVAFHQRGRTASSPACSRDGLAVALVDTTDGLYELKVARRDGTGLRLVETQPASYPRWRPSR